MDLIIIGSGPGGYRAAAYAASAGLSVLIVEDKQAGGTCLNRGCIPTKAMCRGAEVKALIDSAAAYGLDAECRGFDFARLAAHRDKVVGQLRAGVETLLAQPGITLAQGHATLDAATRTVAVGGQTYTADNIIIATGSQPKLPPIAGIDSPAVHTSDDMLAAQAMPQSLCIVGAGVIGMEFASVYSALGCQVTVVEYLDECLPMLDADIAARLRKQISKRGVKFYMSAAVSSVDGGRVAFTRKGKEMAIEAEQVLIATGRKANTEGIEGVAMERGFIVADDNMLTSAKGVYAIGDVNGRCMLAHAATMQGLRAVNHILGRTDGISLANVPSAIFTNPEAACVGPTEAALEAAGTDYTATTERYRTNGKALTMNEPDGLLKLMADKATGRIVAAHAVGPHAADMVQEVSTAMQLGATAGQLRDITHIHPTLGEMVQDAAFALQ